MMTPEAKTTDAYKARLLEASSDDTVITRAFTGSPLRALQNSYTKHFAAHPEELGVGGLQVGGQRACRGRAPHTTLWLTYQYILWRIECVVWTHMYTEK